MSIFHFIYKGKTIHSLKAQNANQAMNKLTFSNKKPSILKNIYGYGFDINKNNITITWINSFKAL